MARTICLCPECRAEQRAITAGRMIDAEADKVTRQVLTQVTMRAPLDARLAGNVAAWVWGLETSWGFKAAVEVCK